MAFCTQCGHQLIDAAAFCSSCGTQTSVPDTHFASPSAVAAATVSPSPSYSPSPAPVVAPRPSVAAGPQDPALRTFIGKNEDYFFKAWDTFVQKGNNVSWNWAACIVGVAWFAYRKMYAYAAFLGCALVMIPLNQFVLGISPLILVPVSILVKLACGFFGNFWYQQFAQKKVNEISQAITPAKVELELARQGGVNVGAAIGMFSAYFIILIFIYAASGQVA